MTNSYLVRVSERYLLVDTGYEYEWDLFRKRLAECGIGLEKIGWVLLTHHHDDHSGLLNKIVASNPNVKVILSSRGKELLATGMHFHTAGAGYINRRIGLLLWLKGRFDKRWTHTFPPYLVRADDLLIHCDTSLQSIGIPLDGRILQTPGHSTDHLSVLFDDGDCLAGDAAANFLQWAGAKHCVISVDDLDEYYDSWRKLLASGARRIYPAHGRPFPARELRNDLGRHEKEGMRAFAG